MKLKAFFSDKRAAVLMGCGALVIFIGIIAAVMIVSGKNNREESEEYEKSHFYTGTTLNGIDISDKTPQEAEAYLKEKLNNYRISIQMVSGKSTVITGEEISLKAEGEWDLQSLKERQNETDSEEILNFSEEKLWSYDEEELKEALAQIDGMQEEEEMQPENASIEYNSEAGEYEIIPETVSWNFDQEKVLEVLRESIDKLEEEVSLLDDDLYRSAQITADNEQLNDALDIMNGYVKSVLTYPFDSGTEVIDKELISQWVYLEDDLSVELDSDRIQVYIAGLEEKYNDTSSKQQFRTSYGTYITLKASATGTVIDGDALLEDIIAAIKEGGEQTREVPYTKKDTSGMGSNFGGTYVEIDMTAQHLFLYVNGNMIMETDIVTGNVSEGYTTPTGVYTIRSKSKNATLRGPGYETPVKYWMPFNGGIGLHDAWWRTEFGGNIYLYEGSHGCVNMPESAVKVIYDNVSKGTYVICYGGETSVPAREEPETGESTAETAAPETAQPETTKEEQTTKATEAATTVPVPSATQPSAQTPATEGDTLPAVPTSQEGNGADTSSETDEADTPVNNPAAEPSQSLEGNIAQN